MSRVRLAGESGQGCLAEKLWWGLGVELGIADNPSAYGRQGGVVWWNRRSAEVAGSMGSSQDSAPPLDE